ncbi:MAG: hypothetical protein CEE38_00195 [Planctomycetes bacterium B3_Pla]|nr:MAG: hypothetical protein CEE38_00195 [Planctomycetes bacterium B3_Pla]
MTRKCHTEAKPKYLAGGNIPDARLSGFASLRTPEKRRFDFLVLLFDLPAPPCLESLRITRILVNERPGNP